MTDAQALLRALHDEKLGVERMADSARMLQRILKHSGLSKDASIAMHSITSGCAHLLAAYRNLSEITAMQGLCLADADLAALTRRVVGQHMAMAIARDVQLSCRCPSITRTARIDPVLVERLLDNLISNAMKHARRGGSVTVKLTIKSNVAHLSVRDNGRGISRHLLPHVFEPYVVGTERAGSGLGLSNVKRIAELHGGTVRCVSREGAGTLMIASLPL